MSRSPPRQKLHPRYKDDSDSPDEENGKPRVLYSVEFTFDADARVAISIYCQASEEFSNGMAVYNPGNPALVSETVHYKRGVSQQFSQPSFKIDFSEWKEEELNFDLEKGIFPVVIQAVVDDGDVIAGHAHVLLAAFEKHVDGSFSVKPLKQKQIVDRVSYLLQEIYGIENKNNQETKPSDDENSDNSNECVVCLSDLRDTLILPCRHLCLCNSCADTLRYQANNCPICRLPFRALLQIRAVRKKPGVLSPVSFSPVLAQTMDHDEHSVCDTHTHRYHPCADSGGAKMNTRCPPKRVPSAARFFTHCELSVQPPQSYSVGGQRSSGQLTGKPADARPDYRGRWCASSDNIPPGFEPISLLEALNGQRSISPSIPSAPLYEEINFSGGLVESLPLSSRPLGNDNRAMDRSSKSPDSTLCSPSSPIQEEDEEKLSEVSDAQPHPLIASNPNSPETTATEDSPVSVTLKKVQRSRSMEDILQDRSSEHSSLTKTDSDPPVEISLPGKSKGK
ncbi:UNVERIFIED_CONTAM: hypothetical protein FKN15_062249 [Acipenser sinensis]